MALFALPALDKLQQQQQGQQGQGGGAAVPKSLREDLRWLSTLWCGDVSVYMRGWARDTGC